MVEFGLKLKDNKVGEWSEYYIDYEKLKRLLKSAKKASDTREELESRNLESASCIRAAYDEEKRSRCSSKSNLSHLVDEDYPLLQNDISPPKKDKEYESLGSIRSSNSEISLGNLFDKINAVGYFQRQSYNSKVEEALKHEDFSLDTFSDCLYEESKKVNGLYSEEIDDLKNRLDHLIEQAGYSIQLGKGVKRQTVQRFVEKKARTEILSGSDIPLSSSMLEDDSDDEKEFSNEKDKAKQDKIRESKSIERSLIDLHRRANLLSNFSIVNFTGFIKITKKFDKNFPSKKGYFKNLLENDIVSGNGNTSIEMAEKMEGIFSDWFCQSNIIEARTRMLPKKGDGLDMDWSQLRLGYRLGMCSILALWVCWDCVWGLVKDGNSTIGGRTAFPVFRACGGLLLVHWFWGICVYVWNRFRINYIYLFDFHPQSCDSPITIFEDATDETLVFFLLMLLYYKSGVDSIPHIIPSGCYPFILVLYAIKCLLTPFRTRKQLWRAIAAVLSAPLTTPTFFHTYLADIFTSLVKVFQDIFWTLCFIFSGDFLQMENDVGNDNSNYHNWHHTLWYKHIVIPLICLFPLWIRFNQCLRRYMVTGKRMPHLANAFKYAMSQTVTLFGAFHPLYLLHHHSDLVQSDSDGILIQDVNRNNMFQLFWMGLFILSSLYSFFWDVYMDWGLGRPEYNFLGSRLMFPKRIYYYTVIVLDLFLRFMWVLTLVPPHSGARFELPNYLTALTMALELCRRAMWGFFRLENEHRCNTEGFRRVEFVPLHFSTGHDRAHDQRKTYIGWNVLGEVTMVSVLVIGVSVGSIIAAQRSSKSLALPD